MPDQEQVLSMEYLLDKNRKLDELKKELDSVVDAFSSVPSMINKMADYWGAFPLWQKLAFGILGLGSLCVISLITQFAVSISLFSLFSYIVVGLFLEEHHRTSRHNNEKFKSIIRDLTDLLASMIDLVEAVYPQLQQELDTLQQQNSGLGQRLSYFTDHVEGFTQQMKRHKEQNMQLNCSREQLNQTVGFLTQTSGEHAQLVSKLKSQVSELTQHLDNTQAELSEKNIELESLRYDLESELQKAQKVISVLETSVKTLSDTVLMKQASQYIVNKGLEDHEKNLLQSVNQVSDIQSRLDCVETSFTKEFQLYRDLNEQHKVLLANLEQETSWQTAHTEKSPCEPVTTVLNHHSIYARSLPLSQKQPIANERSPINSFGCS